MSWILNIFCSILLPVLAAATGDYRDYQYSNYNNENEESNRVSCIRISAIANTNSSLQFHSNTTSNRRCWIVESTDKLFVTIRFLDLQIPFYGYCPTSTSNHITIDEYNNPYSYSNLNSRKVYCGYDIPTPLTFYSREFKVELITNNEFGYEEYRKIGFQMQYQLSSAHQTVEVDKFSFITSPGYPHQMVSSTTSTWSISLAPNSTAKSLQFVLNSVSFTPSAVLFIYDGLYQTPSAMAVLRASDLATPYMLSSSGPNLYIKLVTYGYTSRSIYKGFNATVKAKGFCLPGTTSCGDDENCFTASQRCDAHKDCHNTAADERGCSASCKSDEFWCGYEDSTCFSQSQLCDGISSCSNKLDESNCGSCASNAFFCNTSKICISESWKCDGQKDCANGEDEVGCSATEHDIAIHTYRFITSPNYPNWPVPNPVTTWKISLSPDSNLPIQLSLSHWNVDSSSVLEVFDGPSADSNSLTRLRNYDTLPTIVTTSTGPHMFLKFTVGNYDYVGNYDNYHTGFNATVKVKGYCLPGSSPCGDGVNCFTTREKCDRKRDCHTTGIDEKGCEGCSADEYWCGSDHSDYKKCYTDSQRCNGHHDCYITKVDEDHCESCSPGAFLCKWSNKCVYEKWRCDGQKDCNDNEDELNCSYPASRKVITAAIVGSLVCGLLLAIALGCTCKLYTLRIAPNSRNRRNRTLPNTPLSRIARELLQREAPPSYNMTVEGVENSSESSRRSSSSRRRRERRRRRRNREPRIRRARPSQSSNEGSSLIQDNNRDDIVLEAQQNSGSHAVSNTSVNEIDQTPGTSASAPAHSSNLTEVPCVLAEMGLVEHSDEMQQISSSVPVDSTPGTSQSNVEPQAPPLPQKRPIPPVMVEAPFNTVMVDDIPSCVYPNPPSYHEATIDTPAPPTPEIMPPVVVIPDENQTKPLSKPKEVSKKPWVKQSPKKLKKFLNFPLFQVFSIGQSNGSQELRETAENVHLDDEQVQLISDFVTDDVDDDFGSTSGGNGEGNQISNSKIDEDGSSVFEMQSYTAPNPDAGPRNVVEDRGSPVSLLIDISPTQPLLDLPDSSNEMDRSVPGHEDDTAIELPALDFSQR